MSAENTSLPLLSLQNINAGYRKKIIVRDISFTLLAGEFCALLGLNGSGKTTLLKAICGLLPVESGRCLSAGRDLTRLNEKKRARHISYIPQRSSKLIGVTVLDAVLMGLNAHLGVFETPKAAGKALAVAALEKMNISHLAGEDFSRLSEGQKQMVILTRALLQDAPVMLMDEPDNALDFPNKHRALAKISAIIKAEKKAGLITLHDPNLALAYCDRLILLNEGQTVARIRLSEASKEEIHDCLSTIYGDITLLEYEGNYRLILYRR